MALRIAFTTSIHLLHAPEKNNKEIKQVAKCKIDARLLWVYFIMDGTSAINIAESQNCQVSRNKNGDVLAERQICEIYWPFRD